MSIVYKNKEAAANFYSFATVPSSKETLIKSFVHIAPSDFSSGCTNKPQ